MDPKAMFKDLGLATLLTGVVVSLLFWEIGWIIYCRYFHSLARVPGPYLASISELYRFYHNFIRKGALYLEFDKLREQYGEILTPFIVVRLV